jgi:O-antigen/teichoic acid export membrane protein
MNEAGSPIVRSGHRVVASVLSGGGSLAIVGIIALVIVRVSTSSLGLSRYGLFVTAITYVSTVVLLTDLGVSGLTGREIAKDPSNAEDILGQNLGLRLTLSVLLMPVIILIGIVVYHDKGAIIWWAIAALSLSIPFQALRTVSFGFYLAGIRNYYDSALSIAQQLLYLIGAVIALKSHLGIIGFAGAYSFSTVVAGIVAYFLTRREMKYVPRFNPRRWRELISQSIAIGLIQIVNRVYLNADTLILSVLSSASSVGIYGVACTIIALLSAIPGLIMTSLLPLIAVARSEELEGLIRRAAAFLAFLGVLVATGTYLFAPAVVLLIAGPRFLGAVTPVRVLGISLVFTYITFVLGYSAFACNRHHKMIVVNIFGLLLNIVTNILVIPKFHYDGAAWATVFSEFALLIGVSVLFRREVKIKTSVFASLVKPLGVGLVICAIGSKCFNLSSEHSIDLLFVPVVVVAFIILVFAVRGLPEDMESTLRRVLRRR